tara:strand:- start:98 stop:799 length:702 start_codon:yes stop_codon:yes gene_type:complete
MMATNKIKFICGDAAVKEHYPPLPASKVRPEWYNNINAWVGEPHNSYPTIKKCMPVFDTITSGYIVFNPVEQRIRSSFRVDEKVQGFEREYPMGWGIQSPQEGHEHSQCPVRINGNKKDYITFSVPWRIETPPGYSCIIQSPFYHFEERFKLFPAIIDTDVIDVPWHNWPGVMMQDEFTLQPGEPLAQIIPFKREDWEMEVELNEEGIKRDSALKFFLSDSYSKIFHKKKKFK